MLMNLGVQGASRHAEASSSLGDATPLGQKCFQDVELLHFLEGKVSNWNMCSNVLTVRNFELEADLVDHSTVR